MKAVLAPVGTRGDVQPMVALGQRLRGAGHDVTVAAAENFRGLVEGAGLRYVRGGRDAESIVREQGEGLTNPIALLTIARSLVEEQFVALEMACGGDEKVDVLVGSLLLVAGPSIAERFGLPLGIASYFPGGGPTADIPSPLFHRADGPAWFNRASWALQGLLTNVGLRGPLNRHRARLGLAPVGDVQDHMMTRSTPFLATDVELAPPPSDWQGRIHTTGFWFFDTATPLPADVEAFLEAGEPPVYVGFGSMPHDDPGGRVEIIADACRVASCRAIVSAGWAKLGSSVASAHVLSIGPVNHRLLFERVAAVVHHGGAGTTAAAARAGVPQIVVPHMFDQFYWGARIAEMGLGPPPLPTHFTSAHLVSALRVALEDAAMKERAQRMSKRLASYSGADRAVVMLEKLVAGAL